MNEREKVTRAIVGSTQSQRRRRRPRSALLCCALSLGTAALLAWGTHATFPRKNSPCPANLRELLALAPGRIGEVPVARLNLLCGTGLCPANEPDLLACAATLEAWAARVGSETERHRYRFERNPGEFENSTGFFRMLMLSVVLAEDFGSRAGYPKRLRASPPPQSWLPAAGATRRCSPA